MDVQFGPNAVDEPNLLYKLQRKIKVFNTVNPLSNRGYNLVVSSSKYGVVFVGSPNGMLSVYYLRDLINRESDPQHMVVKLQERPTHIAVSCDQELLVVTGGQVLYVYRVADFQGQNVSMKSFKLDASQSTFVSALQWNPCVPDTLAIVFFDGTLLVAQVASGDIKKAQSKARCICWSPKGKQLVTGNSDGTLSQYKPDLTLAKNVAAPNIFEGAPIEALAIYWISTFQFAVVYKKASNTENNGIAVTIVNTPKAGPSTCLNYEDICYSMGSNRPCYYYLQGLPQWNLILTASSNSMEIATLGSTDGANWYQWCQSDEARPELPLTDKKIENYPVGLCIDTCALHQLPWGENEMLPHMPLLLVLSQTGLLTIFNVINLKKDAPALCTPPQQFALPGTSMTSELPSDVPEPTTTSVAPTPAPQTAAPQPTLPQPTEPQPVAAQPVMPQSVTPQHVPSKPQAITQPIQTTQNTMFGVPTSIFSAAQSQFGQALSAASAQPKVEQKPKPVEVKSAPPVAASPSLFNPAPQVQLNLKPPPPSVQSQPTPDMNAARKAEQERANKLKADQELRNMLVKEVNDFQLELYKFLVASQEMQIKFEQDLESIDSNFNFQSLDPEQLKKDCSLEELRADIVQLKLELVRACAVVAEARTHAEAKDLHQWTQTDPLTIKRVASVQKLAYYVQTQLDQAHRALDHKWNEIAAKDSQFHKPGQYMIRPILDDVYQPLVKQQEILSRQQAVLRTLRNTLKECDASPMFKSTSLLRTTPFRNNKDPLSKLTKNILNMSIEPDSNKPRDSFLTPQKLDALRDMLSNHKPIKIKPVNVELRQQLASMRLNYEKSTKQKAHLSPEIKSEPLQNKSEPTMTAQTLQPVVMPPEPDLTNQKVEQAAINVPTFTPVTNVKPVYPGFCNVARTFESKTDESKSFQQPQPQVIKPHQPEFPNFTRFAPPPTVSPNTRSVLKVMLQNKQTPANPVNQETKSDANTFMGQKICSPFAWQFSPATPSSAQPTTASIVSKPISDINNMFQKFTPQEFVPKTNSPSSIITSKSDETGEPDNTEVNPIETSKEQKPMKNLFEIKSSTPLSSDSQNVPDVLKINPAGLTKMDEPVPKLVEKDLEKCKENIRETRETVAQKGSADKKENIVKPLAKAAVQPSVFVSVIPSVSSPSGVSGEQEKSAQTDSDTQAVPKAPENSNSTVNSNAASLFAAANAASPKVSKSQPFFGSPTSTPSSEAFIFSTPISSQPSMPSSTPSTAELTTKPSTSTTVTSPSSLFGSVTSQASAKTTQAGNVFSSSGSQGSLFGTATTTTAAASALFGTTTTQSAFSTTETKPTIFSTPNPASPSSIFGAAAAATAPATSGFGSRSDSLFATTTASSAFGSGSIFGGNNTSTSPTSVLGSPPATTAVSVFGSPGSSTPASVFGSPATSQNVFGAVTTTTQSVFVAATTTQSIFGATTPAASVFGAAVTTTQSVFGSATSTTQASVFGSPITQATVFGSPTPTTQSSVFGATTQTTVFGTPTAVTQASVFGRPQTTQPSVFGSPQTTQSSVFGQSSTKSNGSLFGEANNLFAAATISTNASPPSTGGSFFGGGSSGSVFGSGSNTNVFGSKATFSQTNPTAASIFGGGSTGGGTAFGQKPATDFWSGANNRSSGGFGSSAFGQQTTTQSSSIFGGSSGGSFSAPSSGQSFGSPQQSSVFGSPQQQQSSNSPSFGGSPVFGSKPAFGQPAGFGSSPSGGGTGFGSFGGFNKSPTSGFGAPATFGGGATFGGTAFGSTSPGKAFGGGGTSPGFGAPTQSNPTFENLATQNTLTFGNLAQQSQSPTPSAAPAFGNSPSFTGWRG
ncbi:nuclear pore complex protein Nup214-like isoform X3 [Hyposmocoma kahamanoa]|uniref:nuclear pore complex protein Nup214-like isoform X3 n=1 Tax=Hyposmocoma kahamanoa TaxID=1477025 RepID=UPI000E6D869F|nr:nuclear pore complex protein Nup214-like isoform X3 [Hyposmocoma kahamanoa]